MMYSLSFIFLQSGMKQLCFFTFLLANKRAQCFGKIPFTFVAFELEIFFSTFVINDICNFTTCQSVSLSSPNKLTKFIRAITRKYSIFFMVVFRNILLSSFFKTRPSFLGRKLNLLKQQYAFIKRLYRMFFMRVKPVRQFKARRHSITLKIAPMQLPRQNIDKPGSVQVDIFTSE